MKEKKILLTSFILAVLVYILFTLPNQNFNLNNNKSSVSVRYDLKDLSMCVGETEDSLGFTWFSTSPNTGVINIIKTSDISPDFDSSQYTSHNSTSEKTDIENYYSNKVTVSNLEPATQYTFKYGNDNSFSGECTFTTSDFSTDNLEFIALGDPQLGVNDLNTDSKNFENTLNTALSTCSKPRFLLSLGDQTQEFDDKQLISRQYSAFFNYYNKLPVPVAVVNGNHEVRTSLLMQHVNIPKHTDTFTNEDYNSTLIGDYHFTSGNALIMVLNTSFSSSITEHQKFIDETLKKFDKNDAIKWKIVAFHTSIYSAAGHVDSVFTLDLRNKLAPLLSDKKIDLVLMGHDHVYVRSYPMTNSTTPDVKKDDKGVALQEFTNPGGPIFITLNSSSGSKHYELNKETYKYAACISQKNKPNYSHVKATNTALTVTTYNAEDKSVVDTVTIKK